MRAPKVTPFEYTPTSSPDAPTYPPSTHQQQLRREPSDSTASTSTHPSPPAVSRNPSSGRTLYTTQPQPRPYPQPQPPLPAYAGHGLAPPSAHMERQESYGSRVSGWSSDAGEKPRWASESALDLERGDTRPTTPDTQTDLIGSGTKKGKRMGVGGRIMDKLFTESHMARWYLLVVVLHTVIDLAIEGDLLIRFNAYVETLPESGTSLRKRALAQDDPTRLTLPVYLGVFGLAHLFLLVFAFDAVHQKNVIQLAGLLAFNLAFLVYAIVQINEVRDIMGAGPQTSGLGITDSIPVDVLTTLIPCVIAVAIVLYAWMGFKLFKEFGWSVYKKIGADRRIKRYYRDLLIFQTLIKFCLFFFVAFSLQLVLLVLNITHDFEYYLTIIAIPASVGLLAISHLGSRKENKPAMWFFMVGCVGGSAYFSFKLYRIFQSKSTTYREVWKSLTIFAVLSIVLLAVTFATSCVVTSHFGSGLRETLDKSRSSSHIKGQSYGGSKGGLAPGDRYPMSRWSKRMSID